jgi:thioredoxin 1
MATQTAYSSRAPSRAELDALPGATVVEFGTDWCGYCQGAQASIAKALQPHASVRHLKIEDGPGRPLGRSFKVKLWPTLVLLRDGAAGCQRAQPVTLAQCLPVQTIMVSGIRAAPHSKCNDVRHPSLIDYLTCDKPSNT